MDGSIVDFVTNVFFELGVFHALTQERRQSTLVKTEAILLSTDFMCKTSRVELIFNHLLWGRPFCNRDPCHYKMDGLPVKTIKRLPEGSRGSRELLILLARPRQIDIERYL